MDPIDSLAASTIALGRQVYVAEGCIHCHSQFVRPGTPDVLRWGPARPLSETLAGEPPLPGNRRQGPDLQNVGNRRSPEWNRLHLENPRALAPGSAMPAYGFLFRAGDPRGPALVAYLVSLGAETGADRAGQIAGWNLSPGDGDEARGAVLFQHWCAVCHGDDGRGRGPMAARLAVTPANLRDGPWPRTGRNDPVEARRALARMIKFGAPGTTMPGHETLRDAEIAALTARVAGLRLAAP
jgi:cytochrome c oxidase cbb3-type subunit 2